MEDNNKGRKIFFAYESGHADNKDAINRGIDEYNKHQKSYFAFSWEEIDTSGQLLNAKILDAIDECEIFACDLTYKNHNVLFELGYAIGKSKQLLILLNPTVKGAKEAYEESRILQNIGYEVFNNGKDILRTLQNKSQVGQVIIERLMTIEADEKDSKDILYLSSRIKNQASLELDGYISSIKAEVIKNDTTEVHYQTLIWYLISIAKCKNMIVHLTGVDKDNNEVHNAEYSLFAGLGCGLGKKVLLIAPEPFKAPIDYSDILIEYESSSDCISKIEGWLKGFLKFYDERDQDIDIHEEKELNLLKLGIGYGIAEDEEETLHHYFIEIDTYHKILERKGFIITGRKGAGKTAIFIKLRDHLTSSKEKALSLILKPESDELLDDIELHKLYDSERSRRALFNTVCKIVFYTGALRGIYNLLCDLHPSAIVKDSVEEKIIKLYEEQASLINKGHFGIMAHLYREWNSTSGFGDPATLERIYTKIIKPMSDAVQEYIQMNRFSQINIIADNLDITWDAKNDLTIQADMILSLLEFNMRIPKELDCPTIKPYTVLFLRTDIYDYVLKRSREPDKLEINKLEINWAEYPERLKELIESRFMYILNLPDKESVQKVWEEYFEISQDTEPFDVILQYIVARPRDIIYFVSKLFESAVNRNGIKIKKEDLDYAIDAYSHYINTNMIAETKAEFPEVVDILNDVQNEYLQGAIDYYQFKNILYRHAFSEERIDQFIDFLLDKNYLLVVNLRGNKIISSGKELRGLLNEKIFWVLNKNKIYIVFHPHREYLRIVKRNPVKINR